MYDVAVRLNDQILVNAQQLAVLVRTFNPGDEVTLTVIREMKETPLKVKLVERDVRPLDQVGFGWSIDVPMMMDPMMDDPGMMGMGPGAASAAGAGMGAGAPMGGAPAAGGKGEDDKEHRSASYVMGGDLFEIPGENLPPSVIGAGKAKKKGPDAP